MLAQPPFLPNRDGWHAVSATLNDVRRISQTSKIKDREAISGTAQEQSALVSANRNLASFENRGAQRLIGEIFET